VTRKGPGCGVYACAVLLCMVLSSWMLCMLCMYSVWSGRYRWGHVTRRCIQHVTRRYMQWMYSVWSGGYRVSACMELAWSLHLTSLHLREQAPTLHLASLHLPPLPCSSRYLSRVHTHTHRPAHARRRGIKDGCAYSRALASFCCFCGLVCDGVWPRRCSVYRLPSTVYSAHRRGVPSTVYSLPCSVYRRGVPSTVYL